MNATAYQDIGMAANSTAAQEKAELEKKIDGLQAELSQLNALRQENERLHSVLEAKPEVTSNGFHDGSKPTAKRVSTVCSLGEADHQGRNSLDYRQLAKKFDKLTKNFEKVSTAYKELFSRYKSEKETIKAWKMYIERFEIKAAARVGPTSSKDASSSKSTSATIPDNKHQLMANLEILTGTPHSLSPMPSMPVLEVTTPLHALGKDYDPSRMLENATRANVPSTSGTVPQGGVLHKYAEGTRSSLHVSNPVVASSLGDKAYSPTATDSNGLFAGHGKQPDSQLTRDSSSPSQGQAFPKIERPRTPLHDDISNRDVLEASKAVSTDDIFFLSSRSLKRKRTAHERNATDAQKNARSTDGNVPQSIRVKSEDLSSSPTGLASLGGHGDGNDSLDLDEVGAKITTPKKRRQGGTILGPEEEHSGPDQCRPPTSSLRKQLIDDLPTDAHQDRSECAPLVSTSQGIKRRKVELFTEDGDHSPGNSALLKARGAPEPDPERRQRLVSLLEAPLRDRDPLVSLSEALGTSRGRTGVLREKDRNAKRVVDLTDEHLKVDTTKSEHKAGSKVLQNIKTPHPRRSSFQGTGNRILGAETLQRKQSASFDGRYNRSSVNTPPLRNRSTHQLELEHFKVNPRYNQGFDFAFGETIRKRDERRCLPGCIRPECCGKIFRRLAEIEMGHTFEPGDPGSKQSQEDREDRLLSEHVGDDAGRLHGLASEERKELLLQARTKQLAGRYGRHKQAYERRVTPPGFWRTEMPSTQEIEYDRKEARRLEREQVEERRREAMRPGGRWLFRDEI
ncbi:MAG: hypothetical protein M1833_002108 [Piccolia ochrophora]|nr:MAG: hypothetical protein M1833_002108 [Piccolia ochrophora]